MGVHEPNAAVKGEMVWFSPMSINVCSWDMSALPQVSAGKKLPERGAKAELWSEKGRGGKQKGCSSGTLMYSCKARLEGRLKRVRQPGYLQSVEKSLPQSGGGCLSILKGM